MSPRPVAIFAGCNSLDEACIKFIPGNKRRSAKKPHADGRHRFALSSSGASIGHDRRQRPIAGLCGSAATAGTSLISQAMEYGKSR
jgi:hypothetical protein